MTLVVAAVLLGIGVPSFRDFMRSGRLTGAANETLVAVIAARNEAVRRQTFVSVCPTADPTGASPVCAGAATAGFISFVDTNSNCIRESTEAVVATVSIHSLVKTQHNNNCMTFASNGFRIVVAGQPTTARAVFCDEHGNTLRFPGGTESWARGIEFFRPDDPRSAACMRRSGHGLPERARWCAHEQTNT